MNKILIVEDELNIASVLEFNLTKEGYDTDILTNAEEALPVFHKYDMMVLDIMLPKMSGLELTQKIRKIDLKYPILITSAKTTENDIIKGLSVGADDYITKPFSLPEFILRVKRILERQTWYNQKLSSNTVYEFDNYSINFNTLEANTTSGTIKLTPYEAYIMKYLIENADRIVTRIELLEKVWGYTSNIETRTVDAFIARLRKYFEPKPKKPKHIISIRGAGYRFFKK